MIQNVRPAVFADCRSYEEIFVPCKAGPDAVANSCGLADFDDDAESVMQFARWAGGGGGSSRLPSFHVGGRSARLPFKGLAALNACRAKPHPCLPPLPRPLQSNSYYGLYANVEK